MGQQRLIDESSYGIHHMGWFIVRRISVCKFELCTRIGSKLWVRHLFFFKLCLQIRIFSKNVGSQVFKNVIGKVLFLSEDTIKKIPVEPNIDTLRLQSFDYIMVSKSSDRKICRVAQRSCKRNDGWFDIYVQ